MRRKDLIKQLIADRHLTGFPKVFPREIEIPINLNKIITIIGPRRSGKTSLLYHIAQQLLKTCQQSDLVFINFEDERLEISSEDLDLVLQAYFELYPTREQGKIIFLFDEIQNIKGWEAFVRRLYDTISPRIFLTGSNSRVLSREIATALRGRSLSFEVLPLSFSERLLFLNIKPDPVTTKGRALLKHQLEKFLSAGGFPEITQISDTNLQTKILQEYYEVMLFRDLVERYRIRDITALKFFMRRMLACSAREFSVNKIFNDLKSAGLKVGKDTLYRYLDYAESVYIVQVLKQFSRRVTKRELGEKKIYAIDHGLFRAVSPFFDLTKALEQAIFLELRHRGQQIWYFKGENECDFVLADREVATHCIQVSYSLESEDTKQREFAGLIEACRANKLKQGTIITWDRSGLVRENGVKITLVPVVEWLLEK